jgi:hypothetical protein
LSIAPGPGGWILNAQQALDDLSTASTLSEVEDRFGTARRVTESVLGYPVSGGHATRRAIRAVGRLLTHPLGPALCAEALAWAASVARTVETSTLETLLELAGDALGAYRPWRLEYPPAALDAIATLPSAASRRQALLDLWRRSRAPLHELELEYRRDTLPLVFEERDCGVDDIALWLRTCTDHLDVGSMCDIDPAEQRRLVEAADAEELERIARSERLFDLDVSVVGTCLLRATRTTLENEACPSELRDRVRYPYDLATLELAVRAGPGCFEAARVRRMLGELGETAWRELVEAEPKKALEVLRTLGFVTADELATGRLRHLDLIDRATCLALFGSPLESATIDVAFDVMVHHPDAGELAWLLDEAPIGRLTPERARHLASAGCPPIAKAALRHLPLARLEPSDWELAMRCGVPWMAACPGRPAVERPPVPERVLEAWRPPASRARRIWYPPALLDLEDARFAQAPGWRVSFPRTVADIERNAKVMRNCTATMVADILDGSTFVVVVYDPQGRRYNVEVTRDRTGFVVGQVNSWKNGGIEPPWIRTAFTQRLSGRDAPSRWDEDGVPRRTATPHRDRRRALARVARRKRR